MRRNTYPVLRWAASVSVLALLVCSNVPLARATVMAVAIVDPGAYGESDDYFVTVWGNPRDMNDPADLYILNSSCNPTAVAMWTNTGYANGIWYGTTSTGNWRYLFVLNPGWASTVDTGEDGQLRKVDTSIYTQLSFRMRVASGANNTYESLVWTDGPIGTMQRGTKAFQVQSDGQWHIYTMDLSADPSWTSAPVSSLWLQLNGLKVGYRVEIDWIRLTPKQNRQITWTGGSGSVLVYLGRTLDDPEQRSILSIYDPGSATPCVIQASAGSLTIPASLPGGTYLVRVADSGGAADSGSAWVFRVRPIADVVAPSYTSGSDFATVELGNPWDMDSADDVDLGGVKRTEGIASVSASGGVLTIVNADSGGDACSAPWPHRPLALNLRGRKVDTTRYRYFVYRFMLDDAPDQGLGSITRVRWQAQFMRDWPTGRTDDISAYHGGWQTYSLDLSTVQQEVEFGRWGDFQVDVMQIIVNEFHRARVSHLDWAMLTTENTAGSTYTVRWKLTNVGSVLHTTIYWDTDRNWTNGFASAGYSVAALANTQVQQPAADPVAYLPMVMWEEPIGIERSYTVGTSGLQRGAYYYVALKLEDGYNTTWWYSAVPVRIV